MNPFGGGHQGFRGTNLNKVMKVPNPNEIETYSGQGSVNTEIPG